MLDNSLHATTDSISLPERRFWWMAAFLFSYFGLRLLFFAMAISGDIPPDETSHVALVKIFSATLMFPENSPLTWEHGLVTHIPWLYYWLLGKLLLINIFGIPDVLYLRLLNVPMAFGTVIYAWRTLRMVTADRYVQLLLLVAMTNTLMFTFLSASVSYDNMGNLLAMASIYHLCSYFIHGRTGSLGLSWLCQLTGCLVKSSLLPLLLILNLALVVREIKRLPGGVFSAKAQIRATPWRAGLVLAALAAVLGLNIHLYGGNLQTYGKLLPEMRDVLPLEAVMQNRLAAREEIFLQFVEGQISYEQALGLAQWIEHPGDREATVYLVNNYLQRRYSGEALMGPVAYLWPWAKAVVASAFGVHGHKTMLSAGFVRVCVFGIFVAGLFCMLLWRSRRASAFSGLLGSLAFVTLSYGLFVLYYVHYGAYRYYEAFVIGLQGRYLFPVLGSCYVLLAWSLGAREGGAGPPRAVVVIAAAIFLVSDLPFFLYHASPDWFAFP